MYFVAKDAEFSVQSVFNFCYSVAVCHVEPDGCAVIEYDPDKDISSVLLLGWFVLSGPSLEWCGAVVVLVVIAVC